MKKFLIGFFLAFSIFLFPRSVSAASNIHVVQDSFSIAEFNNPQNLDIDFLRQLDDAIYLNSSILSANVDKSNSFWVLAEDTGTYYLQIIKNSPRVESSTFTLPYTFTDIVTFNTVQFISSYSFSFTNMTTSSRNTNNHTVNRFFQDGRTPVIGSFDWKGSADSGVTVSNFVIRHSNVAVVRNYNFPFDPILSPILDYPYNLNIQFQGFTEWLISTGKYRDISSSLLSNHVSGFVNIFKDYGGSFSFFKKYCSEFFDYSHIYGVSDFNIILSKTKSLYQEYLRLKSDTVGNHLLPRVESSIVPETNDSNQILVTNSVDDTTIISLLRDILRSFIALPNTLNDLTQLIINKLDSLDLTTNIVNNGGTSNVDLNPVLSKMDDIIDKLEADTVSVDIDQTTKDDTDDFFDDWNLEFKTALDSKFPVASQLNQFFTGFFERCGIDADSDGEVYQYYNPGVLTASSVSRSAGTASEEDIVSDFLGNFDNSDPSFLDDASFHGVPDLSVSVGGQSVSIVDFRVYAKYRDKIHFIISFVIWTLYLLHLYKALPSIIGQVADVATKTSEL